MVMVVCVGMWACVDVLDNQYLHCLKVPSHKFTKRKIVTTQWRSKVTPSPRDKRHHMSLDILHLEQDIFLCGIPNKNA